MRVILVILVTGLDKFNFILTARINSNNKPKLRGIFDPFPIIVEFEFLIYVKFQYIILKFKEKYGNSNKSPTEHKK